MYLCRNGEKVSETTRNDMLTHAYIDIPQPDLALLTLRPHSLVFVGGGALDLPSSGHRRH